MNETKNRNNLTDTVTNMESNNKNASNGTLSNGQDNKKFRITVYSKRKRLADSDGISAKAAIDGIVESGVLPDDSLKYVEETRFKQTKIKKGEEERTIIVVEEV